MKLLWLIIIEYLHIFFLIEDYINLVVLVIIVAVNSYFNTASYSTKKTKPWSIIICFSTNLHYKLSKQFLNKI